MRKVRIYLADGTTRDMTLGEFKSLDLQGRYEALDKQPIIDVMFYEESDL